MRINTSDDFKKQFKKYDKKLQERLSKAIDKLPPMDKWENLKGNEHHHFTDYVLEIIGLFSEWQNLRFFLNGLIVEETYIKIFKVK